MNSFRHILTFAFCTVTFLAQAFETGQTIRLVNRGKSIFVENSSLDENKNAILWTETNVNAQRWTITAKTNGTFLVQNDYTGFYLAGLTSGTTGKVGQTNRSLANSRGSWEFVPVEGTTDQYHILQGAKHIYALAAADSLYDGSPLTIVNMSNATNLNQDRITWKVEVVDPMEKAFTKDKRDDMMEKWKARAYKKANTGWVIGNGGWWGDAEMFEIVLDALETTGDQQYATMFENLYNNFIARNKNTWYQKGVDGYNEYNDDIAWMCIACVRAYLLTGVAKYRSTAKTNFDGMFKRADCYGNDLLQWKHGSGMGTNSCINGPAAVCACYLAIAQADTSYFQKARKTYMAERGKLFEMKNGMPTGKVWDSYDQEKNSYNYWASTYNQGTCLGAAIMLYNHYGEKIFKDDADAIIKWSEANMANSKGLIHVCQTVSGDLTNFKGIMLRYLRMYAESFNAPSHYTWIAKNAYHAWNNRNSSGITSSAWLTKAEEDFRHLEGSDYKNFGNDGNMTCVSAAFNCHLGVVDSHDAYARNEAEDFNFIRTAPVTYANNSDEDNGGMVGPMKTKNYIGYRRVNFGDKPASHINLRAKITIGTTGIDVFLDEPNATKGILLCSIKGNELSALRTWDTVQKMLNEPVTGVHNVYFVSTGSGQTSINWWQFQSLNNIYADLTNGKGKLTNSVDMTNVEALIDGDIITSCNIPVEGGADTWIQYSSPSPMHIYGYQIFSGDDVAAGPKGWTLQASNDGENWETLHSVSNVNISVHGQCFAADVQTTKEYIHYRLLFDLADTQTKLSISEWQLLGHFIADNDLTADGGILTSPSQTDGIQALIDHQGATSIPTPLTAVYQPSGNYMLSAYSITAGAKEQAPTSWKLEGSANGTTGWKVIDQQTDAVFPYDNYTCICRVEPGTTYLYYRLTVNGEAAQITQWQLFGEFEFGDFYADVTKISTLTSSDGSDASPLTDNDGLTSATLNGNELYWDIASPIPVRVIGYSLVSGNNAESDPQSIALYGYDDNDAETLISSRALTFPARGYRLTYTASSTKLFKKFRLKVNEATGKSISLADFELYGTVIAEQTDSMLFNPMSVKATAEPIQTSEEIEAINDQNRATQYHADFAEPISITYYSTLAFRINTYSITASKNEPTRDPADWTLEASNDGETWTLLDSRKGETFSARYATQFYTAEATKPYMHYRLTVTAVNGGSHLQMGELQLLYIDPNSPTSIASPIGAPQEATSIYNLAGQRLSKLQKGINIMGGKKILVR